MRIEMRLWLIGIEVKRTRAQVIGSSCEGQAVEGVIW